MDAARGRAGLGDRTVLDTLKAALSEEAVAAAVGATHTREQRRRLLPTHLVGDLGRGDGGSAPQYGDPPRTFMVTTFVCDDDRFTVAFYREVAREREALHAKEQLISFVGHELRTSLTSIYGYSQIMARQLGVVQQQVGQLGQLIRDFMDASRLESGEMPLKREPVDIGELARAASQRFHGAYQERRLRLDLPERLPRVEDDPARLGQVMDNLLGNAAKYSPGDGEIVLSAQGMARDVTIAVQDRGAGIQPEHLAHVFDRFYRVPGESTRSVEGFGLGLSIVHDLVAAHGGRVWAESNGEGSGTTFYVALPAATQPATIAQNAGGLRRCLPCRGSAGPNTRATRRAARVAAMPGAP